MKIAFEREKFLAAFQMAAAVAPARSPKAILQNVKLEASEAGVTLIATDLEVGVRVEAEGVDVQRGGAAVLPVSRVAAILRESSDEQLLIDTDGQTLVVKGRSSVFKLPSAAPEEFPTVATFEADAYHELPARLFHEVVRRTLFATDNESTRYALGGVLLEMDESSIVAVATDGRRLARMSGPATSVGGHNTSQATTIVPSRSLQLIDRALVDADAPVQLAARANDILVRSGRAVIYSRLVEGRFPKWRDVLPIRHDAVQLGLPVGPLHAAVRQAAIVASDDSRGVDFTFGDGKLVLAGISPEAGESRIELPVSYDGPEITLTLDHRFVSDFLKVLDPDRTFILEIETSDAAALFTTDDDYAYVVMPLARN